MPQAIIVTNLILALLQAAAEASEILNKASNEGRDVTPEELAALKANRKDVVKDFLDTYG